MKTDSKTHVNRRLERRKIQLYAGPEEGSYYLSLYLKINSLLMRHKVDPMSNWCTSLVDCSGNALIGRHALTTAA
jgi:hypothetical protein